MERTWTQRARCSREERAWQVPGGEAVKLADRKILPDSKGSEWGGGGGGGGRAGGERKLSTLMQPDSRCGIQPGLEGGTGGRGPAQG